MDYGSKPTDGGHLSDISPEEAEQIRNADPVAAKFLRKLLGAQELINGKERWCLWLVDAEPGDMRSSPELMRRVAEVRSMRLASTKKVTAADAATPHLFQENRQPLTTYLAVPSTSSANRRYVPMALAPPDVIANNALLTVTHATVYTFAILHSSVFMAWNAAVSGRLKSDYRISAEITYNNFPWPDEPANKTQIEAAAQAVLDARDNHLGASLADLYDPLAMPRDLVEAHQKLDREVLAAYGLKAGATESEILANLFTRYSELTADLFTGDKPKKTRKKKA
jgi:hypothetical protein